MELDTVLASIESKKKFKVMKKRVSKEKSNTDLDFDHVKDRSIHKKMHNTNPKDLLGANRTVRQTNEKSMMNALDVRVNERVVIGGELAPL